MCLGIPMKLVSKEGSTGKVELEGVRRNVALDLLPEAEIGDYVIVHAGYGIQVLDEQAAQETLDLLAQIEQALR
jgi:hydrogenase expression/formation protein HypC